MDKIRHIFEFDGNFWEVDEFKDMNEGLWLAEIELEHIDQEFNKPDWILEEVTDDTKYLNVELVKHPFTNWK